MRKFIWGALIGAGVALLYAPQTGRRTRSLIRDKATKVGNDMTGFVEQKKVHLSNKMDGYRAKFRSMADRMSETMQSADEREMAAVSHDPSI